MGSAELQKLVIDEFSRRFRQEFLDKSISGNNFTFEFITKLISRINVNYRNC
jgi:hypothetical protein